MEKILFAFVAFLSTTGGIWAQHDPYSLPLWRQQKTHHKVLDSATVLHAFKTGHFNGHFRNYTMATVNKGSLSDYYANGTGGGLRYETAPFRKFQMGISGYFIFNMFSSDLGRLDPITNAANRYEIGLFDIENPDNKTDLDRLEELFLKYQLPTGHITLGKQIVNTPFINPQDGRMRPTEVDALWSTIKIKKQLELKGGYIYKISPRSTVRWFSVGESIGVNPTGINTQGMPSNYQHHLTSKGIFLLQGTLHTKKGFTLSVLNQYTENIFNTFFTQTGYALQKGNTTYKAAIQYTAQRAVNNGGNNDHLKSYFDPATKARVISGRIAMEQPLWIASLNYTRITAAGRFTSPREWGREPFFTFLPRERNEGAGNVHAFMGKVTKKIPIAHMSADLGVGYYKMPSPTNFALNKYGLPTYFQSNLDIKYEFQGMLKGLDLDFLWVTKLNGTDQSLASKYVINKVDMMHVDMVLNYHF